ncbi:MAG: DedA family protein [Acidobacteriaceae bacterium]
MNFFLQSALAFLLLYKYWALFLMSFIAALALPVPAGASLMAAAAFASQGYFNLPVVIAVASLGNIAGDNLGYWLARKYGKPVLIKIGFKKIIGAPAFDWVESEIDKRRFLFIFFSRFNSISTISVNLIAGLTPISYKKFLAIDIAGEVFQVCVYAAIGFLFGESWPAINRIFGQFSLAVISAVVLGFIFGSRHISKKINQYNQRHR